MSWGMTSDKSAKILSCLRTSEIHAGRRMCPCIFWAEQDQLSLKQLRCLPRLSKGKSYRKARGKNQSHFPSCLSIAWDLSTVNFCSAKSITKYGSNKVSNTSKGRSWIQQTSVTSSPAGRELVRQWTLCWMPAPGVGLQGGAGWDFLGSCCIVPSKCPCQKHSKLWTIVEIFIWAKWSFALNQNLNGLK